MNFLLHTGRQIITWTVAAITLIAAHALGFGDANARAVIDIEPVVDAYERCVEGSDPNLAYRCASTMDIIVGEFAWPAGGADPRIGPVYVEGGVFVCTNVPNTLMLSIIDPTTGYGAQLRLYSPSACSGEIIGGSPGMVTSMRIDPQYNPMEGLTVIRFENELGEASFHPGVCSPLPGNLSVFTTGTDGLREVRVLYVPSVCNSYVPSLGA